MDKSKVKSLFNRNGCIKDKHCVDAETEIFNTLFRLMKDLKKRKIPLVEVRAIIQCFIGSVNESMIYFLQK